MAAIKVPAMRLEQGNTSIYLTRLTAGDLSEGLTQPDAWTPTNRQGYQRIPQQARFKKIAEYVGGEEGARPVLAQAIVLNARRPLKFEANGGGMGTLEIPDSALPLWEVDGQHRIGGIRRAVEQRPELAAYPFPVVICDNLSKLDEAVLFFVMNTRQQRVPTDLAQRLITEQAKNENLRGRLVSEGKVWIEKGTEIVDLVNESPNHPWSGKIGIPGVRTTGTVLRQVSFVQSLKPLLASQTSIYSQAQPERVARLLVVYWQALEDTFPSAFADSSKYVIRKTVGIFPLHAIAPLVFDLSKQHTADGMISRDALGAVLGELAGKLHQTYHPGEEDQSFFWMGGDGEAGKYAGAKGFKILTDMLMRHLPEIPERELAVAD